jgi:hypothetical protein
MMAGSGSSRGYSKQSTFGASCREKVESVPAARLRLAWSILVVWAAVLFASSVGSQEAPLYRGERLFLPQDGRGMAQELSVPIDDTTMRIFREIQDLELLQRNIEECYEAEVHAVAVNCLAHQSMRHAAELDGELVARVFSHLAGTPEHERFLISYGELTRYPDRRLRHGAELYTAYKELLQSGRSRLIRQLRQRQELFARDHATQPASQGVPAHRMSQDAAAVTVSNESERADLSPESRAERKRNPYFLQGAMLSRGE